MRYLLTKIHTYSYYAFVFLLPWQTVYIIREVFYGTDKWHYGTIGIYFSDACLIIWIILSLYLYKNPIISWMLTHKKPVFAIFLCYMWIFTSILWAQDHALAFYHATLIAGVWIAAFFSWIIPICRRRIAIIFIISACIHALIGITQFLLQKTFSSSFLGIQIHDVIWGGTATITTHGERWLRAYGGLPHPNMLGGILCIAFLLSFTLYIISTHRTHLKDIFLMFMISSFVLCIIFTFSRTIWIATILGTVALSSYHFLRTKNSLQRVMPLYTLSAGIIILFMAFFGYIFTARIIHDTHTGHTSINERRTYLTHARAVLQEHLWLGTGIGNYTNTAHTLFPHAAIWKVQPVHNAFILIFVEVGLIGSLLLLHALYAIMTTIDHTKIFKDPLSMTIFLILAFLGFTAFFDHWLWSSHTGVFLMAFLTGMLNTNKK